jgi:hypothetical protein
VPLATVAPASGTNQGTGRKTRPHLPPLEPKWVALSASVAPAGSAVPKGTGLVPVPRYSRMFGPPDIVAPEPRGLGIHRPRQGQAVKGAAGPPAAPFAWVV